MAKLECVKCARVHSLPPGGADRSPCCGMRLRPIPTQRGCHSQPHNVMLYAVLTLAFVLVAVAMMRCH